MSVLRPRRYRARVLAGPRPDRSRDLASSLGRRSKPPHRRFRRRDHAGIDPAACPRTRRIYTVGTEIRSPPDLHASRRRNWPRSPPRSGFPSSIRDCWALRCVEGSAQFPRVAAAPRALVFEPAPGTRHRHGKCPCRFPPRRSRRDPPVHGMRFPAHARGKARTYGLAECPG